MIEEVEEIDEEEDEKALDKDMAFNNHKSKNSQRKTGVALGPAKYRKELKLEPGCQSVLEFIGIQVSCQVIKHQIQIFGGHPTNIFKLLVRKSYKNNGIDVEEKWNIKLALSFVIQLASDLNIKYQYQDK